MVLCSHSTWVCKIGKALAENTTVPVSVVTIHCPLFFIPPLCCRWYFGDFISSEDLLHTGSGQWPQRLVSDSELTDHFCWLTHSAIQFLLWQWQVLFWHGSLWAGTEKLSDGSWSETELLYIPTTNKTITFSQNVYDGLFTFYQASLQQRWGVISGQLDTDLRSLSAVLSGCDAKAEPGGQDLILVPIKQSCN